MYAPHTCYDAWVSFMTTNFSPSPAVPLLAPCHALRPPSPHHARAHPHCSAPYHQVTGTAGRVPGGVSSSARGCGCGAAAGAARGGSAGPAWQQGGARRDRGESASVVGGCGAGRLSDGVRGALNAHAAHCMHLVDVTPSVACDAGGQVLCPKCSAKGGGLCHSGAWGSRRQPSEYLRLMGLETIMGCERRASHRFSLILCRWFAALWARACQPTPCLLPLAGHGACTAVDGCTHSAHSGRARRGPLGDYCTAGDCQGVKDVG